MSCYPQGHTAGQWYSLDQSSALLPVPQPQGDVLAPDTPLPTHPAHGHPPSLCRRWRMQTATLCMVFGYTAGCWCCRGSVRCLRAFSLTRSRLAATAPRTTTSWASRASGTTRITGSTCRTVGTAARCLAGAWVGYRWRKRGR